MRGCEPLTSIDFEFEIPSVAVPAVCRPASAGFTKRQLADIVLEQAAVIRTYLRNLGNEADPTTNILRLVDLQTKHAEVIRLLTQEDS